MWCKNLRLSLSNGIFARKTLEANIAALSDLGFKNLEFNMKSVEVEDDLSIYRARRLIEEYNLDCLTIHAATLHVKENVEVHRAVYYGKISLEFAKELSAPVMVVHSSVSRKLTEQKRRKLMGAIFKELVPFARRLNVRLALENLSYASSGYGKNVAEIEEILGIIENEERSIGFTLDFCHSEATGQTSALIERFHDRLLNVHLSDRAHKPINFVASSLHALVDKLREYNYDETITLELSQKCKIEEVQKTKKIVEDLIRY